MKRILKFSLLGLLALILGVIAYVELVYPAIFYPLKKREPVQILTNAKGTNELAQSVGRYGLMMQLTNGGWIAIRYSDLHAGGIRSCAIARDSEGNWFESDRHFCGALALWPRKKERLLAIEAEIQRESSESLTNRLPSAVAGNGGPRLDDKIAAVESASSMAEARTALEKLGFKMMVK